MLARVLAEIAVWALVSAMNLDALATPELLTAKEVQSLKSRSAELTQRTAVLKAVQRLMHDRTLSPGQDERRSRSSLMMFEVSRDPAAAARERDAGARTVAALRRADAISDKNAKRLARVLGAGAVGHPLYVTMLALSYETVDTWWTPKAVTAFVTNLRKNDLMDAAGATRVDAAQAASELGSPFDVLPFCQHARAFDLRKYARDPAIYLEALYRDAASILPMPAFDSLAYEIVADKKSAMGDFQPRKIRVTLQTKAGRYTQESFFGTEKDHRGPEHLSADDFYQVFNKMLADAGAPGRVHRVKVALDDYPGRAEDRARFGLILLTKAQEKSLRDLCVFDQDDNPIQGSFDISFEDFDSVGPGRITQALVRYKALGLLDHLDKAQIAEAERRARAEDVKSLNDVLQLLPGVVVEFEGKGADYDHPYARLVRQLAAISRGNFSPSEIVDELGAGGRRPFAFGFTLAGRRFSTQLTVQGKWMDSKALELVDRATAATDRHGRFYQLEGNGENTPIIYLTTAQYRAFKDESLARFPSAEP